MSKALRDPVQKLAEIAAFAPSGSGETPNSGGVTLARAQPLRRARA